MAQDKYDPEPGEEPIRFTDKRRVDPITGQPRVPQHEQNSPNTVTDPARAEGEASAEDREVAATDPLADPLAEAERIMAEVPDEAIEVEQAHEEPATHEGTHPLDGQDAEISEDPELREVDVDEATGAIETEPAERIHAAEEELKASGYDREAELEEDLRRLQAEYVNYRKRVDRDKGLERARVQGEFISDLMPVLDDISAARNAGDLEDGPFAHIASRLETVLQQQGLEVVGAVGEPFDPTSHEAILQQPSDDVEADHVAILVRLGYRFGDRLLRAAQVIVSTGPAQ